MIEQHTTFRRNRLIYAILIIAIIFLGLASRYFSEHLPLFLSKYSGDTLWALMVFLMLDFYLQGNLRI